MRQGSLDNLARSARKDLVKIIKNSADRYGSAQADRMESKILQYCRDIADGIDHGHVRKDVRTRRLMHFIVVSPFVVVYDVKTRFVLRIIDGRRDISRLIR